MHATGPQIARACAMFCLTGTFAGSAGPPHTQTAWQLFVDDYWVAERSGVKTTLHQPEKARDNPLITGDRAWARNPYLFGTMLFDREQAVLKVWYMSYDGALPVPDRTPILYATSRDALTWDRPDLGLFEFAGSKANNIVLTNYGHHGLYSPSVIRDPTDPDPARRYKMAYWDFPLGPKGYQDDGMCVAFSPDGINWARHAANPVLHASKKERSISDVISVMHDRRHGRYVAYTKGWADPWPKFRQVVRSESTDFVHWSEPEVVLRHAFDEADPQSYGMFVTAYESLYLGLLPSYKDPGNKTTDVQLTVSHDNRTWARVADQQTFIPLGADDAWDDGLLCVSPLVLHEGRILILYGGWDGPHNTSKRAAAIGLATLRKDGFVSLDAETGRSGTVLTRQMQGAKADLRVNVDVRPGGWLKAEVLGEDGTVLPGYGEGQCQRLTVGGIDMPVRWQAHRQLPASSGPLALRFRFSNASLYSFNSGPVARVE